MALWTIVVTIAQPRNYHPDGPMREWHFNGAQLSELVTRLSAAAVYWRTRPALRLRPASIAAIAARATRARRSSASRWGLSICR
jgi:hypothetical protein